MKKTLGHLGITALIIAAIFGTIYVTAQQNYRLSANDPQIQISEDTARIYTGETDAESLVPTEKVDLKNSLATFGIIYDSSGKVLASSGAISGKTPDLPVGVIDKARMDGQNRITWEPEDDVRIAAVVTKADKGYVLIGRNLREIDARIRNLGYMILAVWAATVLVMAIYWFVTSWMPRKKASQKTK